MSSPSPSVFQNRLAWEQWPANTLLFAMICLFMMTFALTLNRAYLTDQANYIANFTEAPTLDWLHTLYEGRGLLIRAVIVLFSAEFLWNVWTTVFGYLFDPTTAVLLLVGILNGLMVLSARRIEGSVLAIALWILIPHGFAETGLLQLRQGFAFAVMLFFAVVLLRPVVGGLIAAMVHTTFAVAFVFAVIARVFRRRPFLALTVTIVVAFSGAYAGRVLFDMFGGRRLLEYSVSQGAGSLNAMYVVGGLAAMVPSVYWLLTSPLSAVEDPYERIISTLAVVQIGCTAFTLFSFFMFPLGAGRVGYLTDLLLIPILPSLSRRPNRVLNLSVLSLMLIYVAYLIGRSYVIGAYAVF